MRDMIFISHANPEDNTFAQWLTLQLAANGYATWCDLTKFLGGEDFWKDAEATIRDRTCKFLYVLSKASNTKDGPRSELQIAVNVAKAHKITDFIIPLHLDDLPHSETNVLLAKLIAVPFDSGWANGLQQLLAKLEKEGVPKSDSFGPQAVTFWWREQFSPRKGVQPEPEQYLSNWFPIKSLPPLYLHTLRRTTIGAMEPQLEVPYPSFMDGIELVTFAPAKDLEGKLGTSVSIAESRSLTHSELIGTSCDTTGLTVGKVRYFLSRLLRDAWDRWLASLNLGVYSLSDKTNCFFLRKGDSNDLYISFRGTDGTKSRRSLLGYKTMVTKSKRFWHFAVDAQPVHEPVFSYRVACHVLFSDDGQTIWSDHRRMHKARRSQCKDWHNPEWRDRLLAIVTWLRQERSSIFIPVGEEAEIEVSTDSVMFSSPVSFIDPPTLQERLEQSEEEDEVDDEEEGEDDTESEDED